MMILLIYVKKSFVVNCEEFFLCDCMDINEVLVEEIKMCVFIFGVFFEICIEMFLCFFLCYIFGELLMNLM